MKRLVALALVIASACATRAGTVVTQPVTRGSIDQSVTATGTVNAEDTVIVGSQVSGTIAEILVDYNSVVREGQVLARLDPSTLQAALEQARATLAQARATQQAGIAQSRASLHDVQSAQATLRQATSALGLAMKTQHRDRALFAQGFVPASTIDADENAVAAARASRENATSQIESTRSKADASLAAAAASAQAVSADEANVRQAELNLSHATITSPVNGTVILRNVSVGQTVAAAFQSPTLFTIARNLGKMELDIAVGEPDVGALRSGQTVNFTVLAYPGITFHGVVYQVRQNPTIVQNVTTYNTVAYIDNRDGRLRPGMTANASIVIAHYSNALIVPLAALQWRPSAAIAAQYHLVRPSSSPGRGRAQSQWGQTGGAAASAIAPNATGLLWISTQEKLVPTRVKILAVSGTNVAVSTPNGTVHEGDNVVIDVAQ